MDSGITAHLAFKHNAEVVSRRERQFLSAPVVALISSKVE